MKKNQDRAGSLSVFWKMEQRGRKFQASRVALRGYAFLACVFIVLTKKCHHVIIVNMINHNPQAANSHTLNFTTEPQTNQLLFSK